MIPSALLSSGHPIAVAAQGGAFPFDDTSLIRSEYRSTWDLRNWQSYPVYNVKTGYSAVGDGVADDTVPFRNAIAAAVSNGSGIIYMPTGTYALAPQVGDTGQLGPYSVTISGTTVTGSSAETAFAIEGAGLQVFFVNTGTLPQVSAVNVGTGPGHWYYVGNFSGATFSLYDTAAHAVSGGSTGKITFSSGGSGVQLISPLQIPIFNIDSSNLIFIGDGPALTHLKGYTIGLLNPATNWIVRGANGPNRSGAISRFTMFNSQPSADRTNLQFRSFDIDHQAGYTSSFTGGGSAGGDITTGFGWDLQHKPWKFTCDTNHLDNVLIFNVPVKNCRGEMIFVGGQKMLSSMILGPNNAHMAWKSNNASSVANGGNWIFSGGSASNTWDFGGAGATDYVLQAFESQLGPGAPAGTAQTMQDFTINGTGATTTLQGMSLAGDANTSFTVQRGTLTALPVAIQLTDAIAAATLDSITATGCSDGVLLSIGNGTGVTGGLNNVTISNWSWAGATNAALFDPVGAVVNNFLLTGNGVSAGELITSFVGAGSTITITGTTFTSTGQDAHSWSGGNGHPQALWSGSVRSNGNSSYGDVQEFAGGDLSPYTCHLVSDATAFGRNGTADGTPALIVFDPTKLANYPTGYSSVLHQGADYTGNGAKTNWTIKADASTNTLISDHLIVDGVTKLTKNAGGKFDLTA